jgi:hypothetical protein
LAPELSIVVCTRNRASALRKALEHLRTMSRKHRWELVLVDNASSDDTPALIARTLATAGLDCTAVEERTPGLSRARNAGWRASRGRIVAFTDDDCYPSEDFPDTICEAFAGDPGLGFVGGRVLLWDPDDAPVTIQLRNEPMIIKPYSFVPAGLIHGANMAFRRTVLEDVGGFDPMLGAGTPFPAEDCDTLGMASSLGYAGEYRPEIVVHHHHRRRPGRDVTPLWRSYDFGRGAYYAKCLLDRRRRKAAAKHWWRELRDRQAAGGSRRETVVRAMRELYGALLYLSTRSRQMSDRTK